MSSEIQTYSNEALGASIRALVDENGNPQFVASDCAKSLGYRDAANMARRLEDDEKVLVR